MNLQSERIWSDQNYIERGQLENWRTLLDVSNALMYSFAQYRHPKLGAPVDMKQAHARMVTIEKHWTAESFGRKAKNQPPTPLFTTLPFGAQAYLHTMLHENPPILEILEIDPVYPFDILDT